jgi:hypothetical protein
LAPYISLLLYLSCLFIIGGFGEVMTMCRKKIIFTAGLAAAILLVTPLVQGAAETATLTVQADKPEFIIIN